MARKVEVALTAPQEAALMDRYGRKCNLEGLIQRAVKEVVRMQDDDVPVFVGTRQAEKVDDPPPPVEVPQAVTDILATFSFGTKLYGRKRGDVVSALILSEDVDNIKNGLWLVAQFDQNDAEWFPITAEDLSPI